jgi:uncharacterized protein DUF6265
MRFRSWVGSLVLLVLSSLVASPAGAAPAVASRFERLSWLAGSWAHDSAGTRSEEHWMAARGGLMVGMNRRVSGGRARSFEFLRIQAVGDSMAFLASPNNRTPTAFPLKALGEKRVVFENLEHDFPQRVIYWLGDDGRLFARVEGMTNGKAAAEDFVWVRCSLP